MRTKFLLLLLIFFLQSCHVPVKREYSGLSGSLVFTQNKKWLINNLYSDLDSTEKEKLNKLIFEQFETLSGGNAVSVDKANSENLLPKRISFNPDLDQLESLQNNSNFDYLVNIRTIKVKDQISALEFSEPLAYSRNEAFAILEVYDLKTLKKIYSQKISSEVSREGKIRKSANSANEIILENKKNDDGLSFNFSARSLSVKNLKKILKDIEEKAIK